MPMLYYVRHGLTDWNTEGRLQGRLDVPLNDRGRQQAARWLIDTGRIGYNGGTGIDTFGPDLGIDETYTVSTLVYNRHRISLEILANLADLPTTGAWILCGGHINKNGAGSTALIYGVIPPAH